MFCIVFVNIVLLLVFCWGIFASSSISVIQDAIEGIWEHLAGKWKCCPRKTPVEPEKMSFIQIFCII